MGREAPHILAFRHRWTSCEVLLENISSDWPNVRTDAGLHFRCNLFSKSEEKPENNQRWVKNTCSSSMSSLHMYDFIFWTGYQLFYSAIAKDYIVGKILLEVLSSYTDKNPNGIVERKAGGKYVIFIVSLFLEDLGQTLCQACCAAPLLKVL